MVKSVINLHENKTSVNGDPKKRKMPTEIFFSLAFLKKNVILAVSETT